MQHQTVFTVNQFCYSEINAFVYSLADVASKEGG